MARVPLACAAESHDSVILISSSPFTHNPPSLSSKMSRRNLRLADEAVQTHFFLSVAASFPCLEGEDDRLVRIRPWGGEGNGSGRTQLCAYNPPECCCSRKKKKTWPFHLLLLLGNVVLYYRRWEGFYSLFFPYFSFLLFRCVRRGRTIISWIEKRYSEHVLIDLRSSRWRFGPCLKENFDIRPNLLLFFLSSCSLSTTQ